MKFSARQEIDQPQAQVFAALSDFDRLETLARARGVDLLRTADPMPGGAGTAWAATLNLRGRTRELRAELTDLEAPEKMVVASQVGGINALFWVELVRLGPARTRILAHLDLRPGNLSGRVFLQSLRLTKPALNARFKKLVGKYAHMAGPGGAIHPGG